MKARTLLLLSLLYPVAAGWAGDFINLNFDEPDRSRFQYAPDGRIVVYPLQDAFRGWTFKWDWWGTPQAIPELVPSKYGFVALTLNSVTFPERDGGFSVEVDSIWKFSSGGPDPGPLRPALHLYQIGRVPDNAWQLQFSLSRPWPGDPAGVYIDGQWQHQFGTPEDPPTSNIDVSPFAGREVQLEFVFPYGKMNYYSLDIYGFVPVPEPSTWVLMVLGGIALLRRLRRAKPGRP